MPPARQPIRAGHQDVERWVEAHVAVEPHLQSQVSSIRTIRALERGDLAAAAAGHLDTSRLDPYNAVWSLGEAAFVALLARDRDRAAEVVSALRATRSHAPVGRLSLQVAAAGIAALDGHAAAARSGLLDAYAGHRAIGASRRQALTGLVMATLLDPGDAQMRAAITESRQLFEKMGAGLWLARLDAAEAGGAAAAPSSPALARVGTRPGERPPVPADRG